jgi:hypothetical protein
LENEKKTSEDMMNMESIAEIGTATTAAPLLGGNITYPPRRFYKRRADVVFAIYIAVVLAWSFFSDQWRL